MSRRILALAALLPLFLQPARVHGQAVSGTILGYVSDSSGAAVVAGATSSADFPVTAGVLQTTRHGSSDCFVPRVSPDGKRGLSCGRDRVIRLWRLSYEGERPASQPAGADGPKRE